MTALKEFIEESKKYTVLLYKKDIIGYDFLCKSFLEMEKQQIIDAYEFGDTCYENAEDYYNGNYNQPIQ